MFWVYAIYNDIRNKIYIGHTADIDSRIARHNNILRNKRSSYTSQNSGVWRLIYKEELIDRPQAVKREKELKSSRGRAYVRSLIKNQIQNPPIAQW